jgi:hypothetical protein
MSDVSMMRNRTGARLAYVVIKLKGKVRRDQTRYEAGKGLVTVPTDEDAGYMVYFPRGHVVRLRNKEELAHYNLREGEAPIINMQGLSDPNSPIGRMLSAQDDATRKGAWKTMEDQVIKLATAKTGMVIMPEQVGKGGGFQLNEAPVGV